MWSRCSGFRMALALAGLAVAAPAAAATAAPLMAHDLPGVAGKEGVLISVTLAPGEANPVHRHDADVFVYVLSGEVVMQVRGGPETVLKPGGTFHESPTDIHVVGRNASAAEPARFLVFLVKNKGAPISLPAH